MAVRTDITFTTHTSPRVVQIDDPSTEITIQDLVDTIRDFEAKPENIWVDKMVNAGGKENLGGGNNVGITVTLQDTQVAFEARGGPSFVQCKITGGNLVAVDANGDAMDPINTTDYVQVTIAQSTSPIDIAGIVDQIWDEAIANHLNSGSTGEKLNAGSAPSAATVADAVWDEARSGHVGAGSFGEGFSNVITDITFLKDIDGGKWKIVGNQMIFYKSDNSTEVARFNLFDDEGNPNQIKVFERRRV